MYRIHPYRRYGSDGGYQNHSGMVSIRVNRPINGIFMISSITFAISSAAMSPQTISGCSVNIAGHGVMLYSVSAPIITAVVPEPGTPSVSIGMKEPQAEALFAASGAATPRISPLPKLSLLPLSFLGHIGNGAGDGRPGAGQYADKKPITEERRVVPIHCAPSFRLNNIRPVLRTIVCPLLVCSSIKSISDTENRPITTTINCTPSER